MSSISQGPLDGIIEWLRDKLDYVNEKLDKGKGTWPEEGYVKDDEWAALLAKKDLLDDIFYVLRTQGLLRARGK